MDSFDTCTLIRYWLKVVKIDTSSPLSDLGVKLMVFDFYSFLSSILPANCFILLGIDLMYT